ncbi:MAG TPA: hypothetical protein VLH56_01350 [Dissulfurispiraceae bacterium]|nr:hypothetical protein [Dissulfurispiraceae bacterium]
MKRAKTLTDRLLGEAPMHMKRPLAAELAALTTEQLTALELINEFPVSEALRQQILDAFHGDATVLDRLERRCTIAHEIIRADKDGLYELMEHQTSMLDLSDSEDITITMTELKPVVKIIPCTNEGAH